MKENTLKPVLTISLLVSNRLDTIRRCLDSLKPIMDAIPCELILVDTSNNPVVHNIMLEYTDKVYKFDWCKDFAKARNVGLENASGEWFMFLDDDEWFVDVEDLILFFASGEYKQYGVANYRIRNLYDVDFVQYSDGWVSRMIRIDEDTRFVGKIHEYFTPLRGETKEINSMVYHSGYIFDSWEKRIAHFKRNESLLIDVIREEPMVMRWRMQLAQEYASIDEWKRLEESCKEAIKLLETATDDRSIVERCAFYAGYVKGLLKQNKHQECLEICEMALKDERSIDNLVILLNSVKAECHYYLKEWENAIRTANVYLKVAYAFMEQGGNAIKKNIVPFLGDEVSDNAIKNVYCILIGSDLQQGKLDALKEHYDKLRWQEQHTYSSANIEVHLINAMAELEFDPIFVQVVTDAYHNRGLRSYMNIALGTIDADSEGYQRIMQVYAKADADEATIWYARAYVADISGDVAGVEAAIEEYFKTTEDIFDVPKKLQEIAKKNNIEWCMCWRKISSTTWKAHVETFFGRADEMQRRLARELMMQVFAISDWQYLYFAIYDMDYDINHGVMNYADFNECHNVICRFAEVTLTFYKRYYREEIFAEHRELLPSHVQAAILIDEYRRQEEENFEEALKKLEECKEIHKEYAKALQNFMKFPEELRRQRILARKAERSAKKQEQIEVAKAMIAEGRSKDAMLVVTGLKEEYPSDLEVVALGLEARLAALEQG